MNKAFVKSVTKLGFHYDSDLKGFALPERSTGKVFIARGRLNGTKQIVMITIDVYPTFSPEEARLHARIILNKLACGINPNEEKRSYQTRREKERKAGRR